MSESFGQRLRRLRKENGFTQCELARVTGICQVSISYYEAGAHKEPCAKSVYLLSKAFGISMEELYMGVAK